MKFIVIYFILAGLSFSMILAVDFISDMSLAMEFQTIRAIFATTTMQEYIFMTIFLLLPFVNPLSKFLQEKKKKKNQHQ